jgi:hypothetical protein
MAPQPGERLSISVILVHQQGRTCVRRIQVLEHLKLSNLNAGCGGRHVPPRSGNLGWRLGLGSIHITPSSSDGTAARTSSSTTHFWPSHCFCPSLYSSTSYPGTLLVSCVEGPLRCSSPGSIMLLLMDTFFLVRVKGRRALGALEGPSASSSSHIRALLGRGLNTPTKRHKQHAQES